MGRNLHSYRISPLPDRWGALRAPEITAISASAFLYERVCAPPEDPSPVPQVLIVAAHPDDEVMGAGARLRRLRSAFLLHLTDGAPHDGVDARAAGFDEPDSYARARRLEVMRALGLAGIGTHRVYNLGLPDQTASFHLAALARHVHDLLLSLHPEIVLTHSYEGGHPDHDAAAFAVHAACALLERGQSAPGRVARGNAARVASPVAPLVVEFPSYHAGPEGMVLARFRDETGARVLALSPAERELKQRLVDCFVTQRRMLSQFPLDIECYRRAPEYDFTTPPHPGRLWYEWFNWGIGGERWREHAGAALAELGLEPPL
jgi:LmbE family N-acetylglucosaminyl deacetylase